MKRIFLLLLVAETAFFNVRAQSLKVKITNPSDLERKQELAEMDWIIVNKKFALKDTTSLVVLDEKGNQVPWQILNKGTSTPQALVFPVRTVKPAGTVIYTIKLGKRTVFDRNVFGRFVPERTDDLAWENDRIGFRMYGPALARQKPSNGVDVWLKRTNKLVLNKFYNDMLKKGLSYHVDYGQGLDCYNVGRSLGAGGVAPFLNDTLWLGNYYDTYKVLDEGPLRFSFVLTHTIPAGDKILKENITVSLDAYSQLNKAEVSYEGDFSSIEVAAGIFLHKTLGTLHFDKRGGYLAYAEDAVFDAGLPSGRSYSGVVIPQSLKAIKQDKIHLMGIVPYNKGELFTYFFGAGWSKWGFESDNAWFEYMKNFATKVRYPLGVKRL